MTVGETKVGAMRIAEGPNGVAGTTKAGVTCKRIADMHPIVVESSGRAEIPFWLLQGSAKAKARPFQELSISMSNSQQLAQQALGRTTTTGASKLADVSNSYSLDIKVDDQELSKFMCERFGTDVQTEKPSIGASQAEQDSVESTKENLAEQKDTFELTLSIPGCPGGPGPNRREPFSHLRLRQGGAHGARDRRAASAAGWRGSYRGMTTATATSRPTSVTTVRQRFRPLIDVRGPVKAINLGSTVTSASRQPRPTSAPAVQATKPRGRAEVPSQATAQSAVTAVAPCRQYLEIDSEVLKASDESADVPLVKSEPVEVQRPIEADVDMEVDASPPRLAAGEALMESLSQLTQQLSGQLAASRGLSQLTQQLSGQLAASRGTDHIATSSDFSTLPKGDAQPAVTVPEPSSIEEVPEMHSASPRIDEPGEALQESLSQLSDLLTEQLFTTSTNVAASPKASPSFGVTSGQVSVEPVGEGLRESMHLLTAQLRDIFNSLSSEEAEREEQTRRLPLTATLAQKAQRGLERFSSKPTTHEDGKGGLSTTPTEVSAATREALLLLERFPGDTEADGSMSKMLAAILANARPQPTNTAPRSTPSTSSKRGYSPGPSGSRPAPPNEPRPSGVALRRHPRIRPDSGSASRHEESTQPQSQSERERSASRETAAERRKRLGLVGIPRTEAKPGFGNSSPTVPIAISSLPTTSPRNSEAPKEIGSSVRTRSQPNEASTDTGTEAKRKRPSGWYSSDKAKENVKEMQREAEQSRKKREEGEKRRQENLRKLESTYRARVVGGPPRASSPPLLAGGRASSPDALQSQSEDQVVTDEARRRPSSAPSVSSATSGRRAASTTLASATKRRRPSSAGRTQLGGSDGRRRRAASTSPGRRSSLAARPRVRRSTSTTGGFGCGNAVAAARRGPSSGVSASWAMTLTEAQEDFEDEEQDAYWSEPEVSIRPMHAWNTAEVVRTRLAASLSDGGESLHSGRWSQEAHHGRLADRIRSATLKRARQVRQAMQPTEDDAYMWQQSSQREAWRSNSSSPPPLIQAPQTTMLLPQHTQGLPVGQGRRPVLAPQPTGAWYASEVDPWRRELPATAATALADDMSDEEPIDDDEVDDVIGQPQDMGERDEEEDEEVALPSPSYLTAEDRRRIGEVLAENRRQRHEVVTADPRSMSPTPFPSATVTTRPTTAGRRPPSRGGESWQPLGQTTPPAYEQVTPELFEQYQELLPPSGSAAQSSMGEQDDTEDHDAGTEEAFPFGFTTHVPTFEAQLMEQTIDARLDVHRPVDGDEEEHSDSELGTGYRTPIRHQQRPVPRPSTDGEGDPDWVRRGLSFAGCTDTTVEATQITDHRVSSPAELSGSRGSQAPKRRDDVLEVEEDILEDPALGESKISRSIDGKDFQDSFASVGASSSSTAVDVRKGQKASDSKKLSPISSAPVREDVVQPRLEDTSAEAEPAEGKKKEDEADKRELREQRAPAGGAMKGGSSSSASGASKAQASSASSPVMGVAAACLSKPTTDSSGTGVERDEAPMTTGKPLDKPIDSGPSKASTSLSASRTMAAGWMGTQNVAVKVSHSSSSLTKEVCGSPGLGRLAPQSEEDGDLSSGTSASTSHAWFFSPGHSESASLKEMMRHSKHKNMIRKLIPSFPCPDEPHMQHSAPSSTRSLQSNSSSSSAAASIDRAMEGDRFTRFTCDLARKIDKEEEARASMVDQLFRLQQKALEKKVREKLRHLKLVEAERSPRWVEKRMRKVRMRAEAESAEIERRLAESKAHHARRKLRLSELEQQVYSWRSSTLRMKKRSPDCPETGSASGTASAGSKGLASNPAIGLAFSVPSSAPSRGEASPYSSGYSTPSSTPSSSTKRLLPTMPAAFTGKVAARPNGFLGSGGGPTTSFDGLTSNTSRATMNDQANTSEPVASITKAPGAVRAPHGTSNFTLGMTGSSSSSQVQVPERKPTADAPMTASQVQEVESIPIKAAESEPRKPDKPEVSSTATTAMSATARAVEASKDSEEAINEQLQALRKDMEATKADIQAATQFSEKEAKYAILKQQKEAAHQLYEQKQSLVSERLRLLDLEREEREVNELLDRALNLSVDEEVQRQIHEVSSKPFARRIEEDSGLPRTPSPPKGTQPDWEVRESHLEKLRFELAEKRRSVEQLHAERQRQRQAREEQRLMRELRKVEEEAEQLRQPPESDVESNGSSGSTGAKGVSGKPSSVSEGGQSIPDAIDGTDLQLLSAAGRASLLDPESQGPTPRSSRLSEVPDASVSSQRSSPKAVHSASLRRFPSDAEATSPTSIDHRPSSPTSLKSEDSFDGVAGASVMFNKDSTALQSHPRSVSSSTHSSDDIEEVEVVEGRFGREGFHADEWILSPRPRAPAGAGVGHFDEVPGKSGSSDEDRQDYSDHQGIVDAGHAAPKADVALDVLNQLVDESVQNAWIPSVPVEPALQHPTPQTAASLLSEMFSEDGSSVESEPLFLPSPIRLPASTADGISESSYLGDKSETPRSRSPSFGSDAPKLSPKDSGPPRPPSPPPDIRHSSVAEQGLSRQKSRIGDVITAEILEMLLGEVWQELGIGRSPKAVQHPIEDGRSAGGPSPVPLGVQGIDTSEAAVVSFLEAAYKQLGVNNEAATVSMPLRPVEDWLPDVLEVMQKREGIVAVPSARKRHLEKIAICDDALDEDDVDLEAEPSSPSGGVNIRERDVESFTRLLGEALVEIAGEEVKETGPRILGWRRPGFGEPPLARFHEKQVEEAKATASQQQTWEKVRKKFSEALRFCCKSEGRPDGEIAGALSGGFDSEYSGVNAGATLANIDEGIDALLEEEIYNGEASWLDIRRDVQEVKNKVTQMIFADLLDEVVAEVEQIWLA